MSKLDKFLNTSPENKSIRLNNTLTKGDVYSVHDKLHSNNYAKGDNGVKKNTSLSVKSQEFEFLHKSSLPNYLKIYEKKNTVGKFITKNKILKKNLSNLSSVSNEAKTKEKFNFSLKNEKINKNLSEAILHTQNSYGNINTLISQDKHHHRATENSYTITQQTTQQTRPNNPISSTKFSMTLVEKLSKFDGNKVVSKIRKNRSNQLLNSSIELTNRSHEVYGDHNKPENKKEKKVLNDSYINYLKGVSNKRDKEKLEIKQKSPVFKRHIVNSDLSSFLKSSHQNKLKQTPNYSPNLSYNVSASQGIHIPASITSFIYEKEESPITKEISENDQLIYTFFNNTVADDSKNKRNKSADLQNGNYNEFKVDQEENSQNILIKPNEDPVNFSFVQEGDLCESENTFAIKLSTEKSLETKEKENHGHISKRNIFEELKHKEEELNKLGIINSFDTSDSKYKFEFIPTNEYN